jgi:DNA polymerase-3 subunit alpha
VENGLDGVFQTQYESVDLEALGLLKIDFLGLRNLTNISKTIDMIRKDDPDFSMPKTFDDEAAYHMIKSGDTTGIFQLESPGMRKLLVNMETSTFSDIVAAIALYRPGPMEIIPTFLSRKFKKEKVVYLHPDLEPILNPTYGTIVYQDQIMLIAWKFAGYTLGEADVLRRAVSKKKRETLEKERFVFVEHSTRKGYTKEVAEEIYDYILKFANYGFNKAHSVAYATIAYQTAYLKARYFLYYFSVLMTSVIGSVKLTDDYYKEALKRKFSVRGPSINLSTDEFIVYHKAIVFPLLSISGLGGVLVKKIIDERGSKPFESFEDFLGRTRSFLPDNVIENLIYGGALDELGLTKKAMLEEYHNIIDHMQYRFVEGLLKPTYTNEELDYGTCLLKEKEVLGINIKYNFFSQFAANYPDKNLVRVVDLKDHLGFVEMLLMIKRVKEHVAKNNQKMAFLEFSDDTGDISGVIFPEAYAKYNFIKNNMITLVYGKAELRNNQLQMIIQKINMV